MDKLRRRIDIGNLQSLMIFGEYRRASLVNILRDTFKEIKDLRVLFIFMYSLDSLPHNFSKLIHLQYLKLKSPHYSEMCLPSTVSRFYHLKFLDLKDWRSSLDLPKGISRLVNLCHFLSNVVFHSNVPEVGKMKLLQELRSFHVKKESAGFELRELGQLEKIGGELQMYGLENVRTREEANEAKLMEKRNLVELALVWSGGGQPTMEDDILDGLKPHSNIRALSIVNHVGGTGPTWLCSNTHLTNLETLHLEGVSWSALPPFGLIHHLRTLKLKNIVGIRQFGPDLIGGITEKSFKLLNEVEFADMPELVEWVGELTHIYSQGLKQSDYFYYHSSHLSINKMLCELALHNLSEVERLKINDASLISFTDLQKLHPLRSIEVWRCNEMFLRALDDGIVLESVQSLHLIEFRVTGKSLPSLFKCFPSLSVLDVTAASDEDHDDEEVLLQFPPCSSLRNVQLRGCKNLVLPVEDGGGFQGLLSLESVLIDDCGKLFSGWSMGAADCNSINPFPPCVKKLGLYNEPSTLSMALLSNLTSLTELGLENCTNITVDGFNPLITSNLEYLSVWNRKQDGETEPYSISVAADLLTEVSRTKAMPAGSCSFQLTQLDVDSISAVLVAPICTCLSTTLRTLCFIYDYQAESFTEEQDQALQLLTSLESLSISECRALQSLKGCIASLL
ncbi:unnamed protein product [Miscanthus lutarioriparius]|uniref:R13L1/DRL21-like LRR repeat region domain-containing protein n=1 Tax=Miscanthus lutarioriparius TaxID=422564 RepID=A0A811Q1Y3_9POAL|nr:unnamed protein product [Miscanthus lutarioriparius]